MFADEKGYLVTEMVLEEFTDDEEAEPAAAVEPSPRIPPTIIAAKSKNIDKKEGAEKTANKDKEGATDGAKEKKAAGKKAAPKTNQNKSGGVQKSMTSFFGSKP